MDLSVKKLVTIICEAELESILVQKCLDLGVQGYTILEARGYGAQGTRDSQFTNDRNISFQTICSADLAEKIVQEVSGKLFSDYAVIVYLSDVNVVRRNKF